MVISDYYYILVYSGTLFLLNSIILLYNKNIEISLYTFILFLTTVMNWNVNFSKKYKNIKKIDKIYVSFIILIIIKNIIFKLQNNYTENLQFYDILIIGFILQILFFYSLSLLCSFLNHPKKSIFHSIMHLNGFVMNLFITNTYTKIF